MSRQIDVSDPEALSVEDRLYLQYRGQLPDGADPVLITGQHPDDAPLPENTGTVNTLPAYQEEITLGGKFKEYDAMTVPQLKRELEDRNMATTGTKGELVFRLLSDDAAPDDDEFDSEGEG